MELDNLIQELVSISTNLKKSPNRKYQRTTLINKLGQSRDLVVTSSS